MHIRQGFMMRRVYVYFLFGLCIEFARHTIAWVQRNLIPSSSVTFVETRISSDISPTRKQVAIIPINVVYNQLGLFKHSCLMSQGIFELSRADFNTPLVYVSPIHIMQGLMMRKTDVNFFVLLCIELIVVLLSCSVVWQSYAGSDSCI